MKILLRPWVPSQEFTERLVQDPALAKALGAKPNRAVGHLLTRFFDASGPVLDKVLARAQGEKVRFLGHVESAAAELDAAQHLEVMCKATIAQTRPDVNATRAAYDADTLHPTVGKWTVRLPQRIYLSKTVPPNTISHVDQWTGEHVLGAQAAQALRASGLSGYELRPVLHPRKGDAHDAGSHIYTRELLPPVMEDATWFASFGTPRRYGLLPYAAGVLNDSQDFARTAEPWGELSTPVWVVRQSVRRWFTQAQLRGWGFRPVVVQGTALYREHAERWQALSEKLSRAGAKVEV